MISPLDKQYVGGDCDETMRVASELLKDGQGRIVVAAKQMRGGSAPPLSRLVGQQATKQIEQSSL